MSLLLLTIYSYEFLRSPLKIRKRVVPLVSIRNKQIEDCPQMKSILKAVVLNKAQNAMPVTNIILFVELMKVVMDFITLVYNTLKSNVSFLVTSKGLRVYIGCDKDRTIFYALLSTSDNHFQHIYIQ